MQPSATTIDWTNVALGAIAGLALFLFGVKTLADALRRAQGGRFERLLRRSSSNRLTGLLTGAAATVALDSSSVTIILMIALIDAGLLPFAAALPMILGANIGTTFSSQIFAWDVARWSPLLIAAGLGWSALARGDAARDRARAMLGLGLVLFGLHEIGAAAAPLQGDRSVIVWLERLRDPVLGAVAGAAITIAIQSSSAMMGISITLAGSGLVSLPAGVAMMLGAEIGTCADTLVSTVGRSRAAVRAGLFHLLFNVASVSLGLALISQLVAIAGAIGGDTGQRVASAHILFNVLGALAALPFVGSAARLLERALPDQLSRSGENRVAPPSHNAGFTSS